uniref:Uncharacterized protein n=1 Tax=Sipha flava TaxID=143950 RepID=A0A2S2QWL9_9HEMI
MGIISHAEIFILIFNYTKCKTTTPRRQQKGSGSLVILFSTTTANASDLSENSPEVAISRRCFYTVAHNNNDNLYIYVYTRITHVAVELVSKNNISRVDRFAFGRLPRLPSLP